MRLRCVGIGALLAVASTASSQSPQSPPMNTGGGRPSVSPDGQYIAFSAARNGIWEIYVIRPDGSGRVQLTSTGEKNFVNLGPPTWIGNRVLVWRRIADTTRAWLIELSSAASGSNRLDASQPSAIVLPPDALQARPSPDGRRLVFQHGSRPHARVAVSNLDGTGLLDLTDGSLPVGNPDWSPDSRRIVITTLDSAAHGQLALVNSDGSGFRLLTHLDPAEGLPQWANWSRDGSRIAMQRGKYNPIKIQESIAHLYLVDPESGAATKLAPHTALTLDETPCWFPDGRRIAFQSNRTGVMEVWMMNADGSGAQQVTSIRP
jgi:Tol biopolymer transport system component